MGDPRTHTVCIEPGAPVSVNITLKNIFYDPEEMNSALVDAAVRALGPGFKEYPPHIADFTIKEIYSPGPVGTGRRLDEYPQVKRPEDLII